MANTPISYLKFGSTTYQINDKNALHSYTLPTASSSTKGGIKIFGSTTSAISNGSSRNYGVFLDKDNKAYVNVPWTDTIYTHPAFTAFSGKPTDNQSPGFGGSFTISQIHQNTSGQVSGTDRTITIPSSTATTSANGLMTSAMVNKLNGIASGANAYSHPGYTSRSSGLYKITVDGTGHVSEATEVLKQDITALGIPSTNTNTTYSASTGLNLSGTAFSLKTATTSEIGGFKIGLENPGANDTGTDKFIPYYIGNGAEPSNHYGKFGLQMFGNNDIQANSAYIGLPIATKKHPGLMHQNHVVYLNSVYNMFTNRNTSTTINSTSGNTDGKNYGVQLTGSGKAYVNVPWTDTTYSNATTSVNGLMTSAMVSKLNSISYYANSYSHPTYTSRSSGLYKITVDSSGHVSGATAVTKDDITALGIPGQDTNTTYGVFGASNGLVPAPSNWNSWEVLGKDGWTNVPFANSTYPGGIKIGFTQTGKNYPVQLDASDGKAYVYVPWTDTNTNTTYSASTGLSLSGTAFSLKSATTSTIGGIRTWNTLTTQAILHTTSYNDFKVGLQSDSLGKGFVSIPIANNYQNGLISSVDYNSIMTKLNNLENQIRQLQDIINGGSY